LAQRYLAEDSHALVGEVDVLLAGMRAVAAVRVGLQSDEAYGPDIGVRVSAVLRALPLPVAALIVLVGVEGVQAVERIRVRRHKTGETLALVETAGAHKAVRRAGGQLGMNAAVVGQPRNFRGRGNAVHGAVRHDCAGPGLVV